MADPSAHRTTLWVVVSPLADVPGESLAHCLDLNIMSQGRSLTHALEMMVEAVDLVVAEDVAAGLDPFDRVAPQEQWAEFFDEYVRRSELTTLEKIVDQATAGTVTWMATALSMPAPAGAAQPPATRTVGAAMAQHARAAA